MERVTLAKQVLFKDDIPQDGLFFLAADIGGTNSNFGVFHLTDKPMELLISLHYKSKLIADFTQFIVQVTQYIHDNFGITLKRGCIGAAGIVYHNRKQAKPTNLTFTINIDEIESATQMTDLFLINDFEAVALGIDSIAAKDIIYLQKGTAVNHANKAFIGAGTGLGKSIALWNPYSRLYVPIASEGGHADAVAYTQEDVALFEFIKKDRNLSCSVSWENLLSGNGLQSIYKYVGTTKNYVKTEATNLIEAADLNPDRISYYAKIDERCRDTFTQYVKFYARCAKNFALDSLALGGLYIAGGIAAKNISMFFDEGFIEEFTQCGTHHKYAVELPIAIVADYNISLYGAVVASKYRSLSLM